MVDTPSIKQGRTKENQSAKKRHAGRGAALVMGTARTSSHKCGGDHGDSVLANPEREGNPWPPTRPRRVPVGHRYGRSAVLAMVQLSPKNEAADRDARGGLNATCSLERVAREFRIRFQ